MVTTYLDFEKPLAELETKIAELEAVAAQERGPQINEELKKLKENAAKQLKDTYSSLNPWRKTQVARHPERGAGRANAGPALAVGAEREDRRT